jgi:hypothetical protein
MKRLSAPLVAVLVVALGALILRLHRPEKPAPPADFRILSADGDTFLTSDDFESYDWATHTITFRPGGVARLRSRVPPSLVTGVPFVVTVDGVECYRGLFTTAYSSNSHKGPCIIFDSKEYREGSDTDLPVQMHYPWSRVPTATDKPSDERVRTALRKLGKLQE